MLQNFQFNETENFDLKPQWHTKRWHDNEGHHR